MLPAMCLSLLIKCQLTPVTSWTRLVVVDVLLIHLSIILMLSEVYHIQMFKANAYIIYENDPAIFENVDHQSFDYLPKLQNGLLRLFESYSYGILICGLKSFEVMHIGNMFYFFDPHSCGAKGASALNGKSCTMNATVYQSCCRFASVI